MYVCVYTYEKCILFRLMHRYGQRGGEGNGINVGVPGLAWYVQASRS